MVPSPDPFPSGQQMGLVSVHVKVSRLPLRPLFQICGRSLLNSPSPPFHPTHQVFEPSGKAIYDVVSKTEDVTNIEAHGAGGCGRDGMRTWLRRSSGVALEGTEIAFFLMLRPFFGPNRNVQDLLQEHRLVLADLPGRLASESFCRPLPLLADASAVPRPPGGADWEERRWETE